MTEKIELKPSKRTICTCNVTDFCLFKESLHNKFIIEVLKKFTSTKYVIEVKNEQIQGLLKKDCFLESFTGIQDNNETSSSVLSFGTFIVLSNYMSYDNQFFWVYINRIEGYNFKFNKKN